MVFMLNERIKHLRLSRSIRPVDLARSLHVTKQSISHWENDTIQPSVEMLTHLARFFSVTTDDLLSLDDRQFLEITDPTDLQIVHIQQVIADMQALQKNA